MIFMWLVVVSFITTSILKHFNQLYCCFSFFVLLLFQVIKVLLQGWMSFVRDFLDVQSTIAEIRSQMAFSRGNTAIGLGNVTEAEFAIQRARDALKVAINTVLNSLQF